MTGGGGDRRTVVVVVVVGYGSCRHHRWVRGCIAVVGYSGCPRRCLGVVERVEVGIVGGGIVGLWWQSQRWLCECRGPVIIVSKQKERKRKHMGSRDNRALRACTAGGL